MVELPMESYSKYSKLSLLGGLNPPDVDNPKHYNPKIEEIFGFRKFISSILSDVEKYSEFNRGIICQIRAKMAEISPLKLRGWAPRYRSNETTIARKQFFAAWSSRIDARRQYRSTSS